MKRAIPFGEQVDISSDDSDVEDAKPDLNHLLNLKYLVEQPLEELSEDDLIRSSRMYQEYMQNLPIPSQHGSIIPFTSWTELAASLKKLYGQPLHYLTNVRIKEWDQMRFGSKDEHVSLDCLVHPSKAEATVWAIEEVHRLTSSHLHLAKLWQADSSHFVFVDPIVPKLPTTT